jgi:hypothetical protein
MGTKDISKSHFDHKRAVIFDRGFYGWRTLRKCTLIGSVSGGYFVIVFLRRQELMTGGLFFRLF